MSKKAIGLMATGVVLGVGAGLPGGAAVGNMAAFMPAAGTTAGAGMAIGMLGKIGKRR